MPKSKKYRNWDSPSQYNGNLSERIQILVTPITLREIKELLEKAVFPNISEFCRFAIRNYLDRYYELEKIKKELAESGQEE